VLATRNDLVREVCGLIWRSDPPLFRALFGPGTDFAGLAGHELTAHAQDGVDVLVTCSDDQITRGLVRLSFLPDHPVTVDPP
jgi:hypothetical protein